MIEEKCPKCAMFNNARYSCRCMFCGCEIPRLKQARQIIREDPDVAKEISIYKVLELARMICGIGFLLLLVLFCIGFCINGSNVLSWFAFSTFGGSGMLLSTICLRCFEVRRHIRTLINNRISDPKNDISTQKENE